jgi:BirA family biotin operon repressor/biotin-[acetyl-CoA-carboxylase] ligase
VRGTFEFCPTTQPLGFFVLSSPRPTTVARCARRVPISTSSSKFLEVEWHDSLPSTNTLLIERAKLDPATPHGTIIAAREQTAGRGRQQRRWIAAPNENITMSLLWNAPVAPEFVPSMAQAISVGICAALEPHVSPTIKWPNDVLVGGKKIGGILCERVAGGCAGNTLIVVGIGLNVNMGREGAEAIDQPVTSLALETGATLDTEHVLHRLLDVLVSPLTAWANDGFPGIRDAYLRLGAAVGTALRVRDGEKHTAGIFLGYSEQGALILRLDSGEERVFYSGDVSGL